MHKSLLIAASLAIGLLGSSIHAEDGGSATLGGSGETGANERHGASQVQPGDRRNTTMGRDQQDDASEEDTQVQDEESGRGTQHGDAPARRPTTR